MSMHNDHPPEIHTFYQDPKLVEPEREIDLTHEPDIQAAEIMEPTEGRLPIRIGEGKYVAAPLPLVGKKNTIINSIRSSVEEAGFSLDNDPVPMTGAVMIVRKMETGEHPSTPPASTGVTEERNEDGE